MFFVALRFISTLKDRYDWTEQDYENEWLLAHSNPKAVWSKDEYNTPVVSLLTVTTASSGRKLSSQAAVMTGRDIETDDVAATFSRCLTLFLFVFLVKKGLWQWVLFFSCAYNKIPFWNVANGP